MIYKVGDILKGKINGRKIEILKAENNHYTYRDLKYGAVFSMYYKALERCQLEKSSH